MTGVEAYGFRTDYLMAKMCICYKREFFVGNNGMYCAFWICTLHCAETKSAVAIVTVGIFIYVRYDKAE